MCIIPKESWYSFFFLVKRPAHCFSTVRRTAVASPQAAYTAFFFKGEPPWFLVRPGSLTTRAGDGEMGIEMLRP